MTVKKRILALTTASLVLAGALTACGGQSATPEETGDSTTPVESTGGTEKVYHIVADNTFAPFEFLDEATGSYTGVDMDLLAAIAEDQGFQYTVDNCGWDAALGNLQSGQADGMIAGMSITDERRESYDFSDSYYDGGQIMLVKGDSTIASYEDLAGLTVAVKTGTQSATFAQSIAEEYGFEVVTYKDSPAVYAAVAGGIDAAGFEDYAVIAYQIQNQSLDLKVVGEQENITPYGFAVLKGQNPELIEMFNAGLANIRESGQYAEIMAKYGIEV